MLKARATETEPTWQPGVSIASDSSEGKGIRKDTNASLKDRSLSVNSVEQLIVLHVSDGFAASVEG